MLHQLTVLEAQHRRLYIGARQESANRWVNVDGTLLVNIDHALLPVEEPYGKDFLVFNFSSNTMHWGFQPVRGDEPLLFICEAHINAVQRLVGDNRTITYGIEVTDRNRIPRGPYFIKQPTDATFDLSKRKIYNDISLR